VVKAENLEIGAEIFADYDDDVAITAKGRDSGRRRAGIANTGDGVKHQGLEERVGSRRDGLRYPRGRDPDSLDHPTGRTGANRAYTEGLDIEYL
jgi:hypothetical protein